MTATDCFWSRCSNRRRCAGFGSCVARWQREHLDDLFITPTPLTNDMAQMIDDLRTNGGMQ